MALSQDLSLLNNFGETSTFADVYFKVVTLGGSKETFSFELVAFKNKDGQELDKKVYSFAYDLNGHNPFRQAYEYLKTTPEFSGANDC